MLRTTRMLLQSVSSMTVNPPREPLIAIVGTTGVGKSQLAVELALRFNGEIINADAVQMYEGLPIITNKIPEDERKGVPHHLLGFIGREEPTWNTDKFMHRALELISDIRKRGRTPILVGGTHYYTQSLLFTGGRVDMKPDEFLKSTEWIPDTECADKQPVNDLNTLDTAIMFAKLKEVDPVMASRWHPNDRRHIRRSLEIWLQTGRPASEIYAEQPEYVASVNPKAQRDESPDARTSPVDERTQTDTAPSSLRFPTLLLWPHIPFATLVPCLDARVHSMCRAGLLAEAQDLNAFTAHQEALGKPVDLTSGVYMAIGYRQFLPLVEHLRHNATDAPETKRSAATFAKLEAAAIHQTQGATRRYAKKQLRWLRVKLLHALRLAGPAAAGSVYVLDATPPLASAEPSPTAAWDANVLQPATGLATAFLAGRPMPDNHAFSAAVQDTLTPLRDYDFAHRRDLWGQRVCDVCGVTAVTELEWETHIKSLRHKKTLVLQRRKEARESDGGGAAERVTYSSDSSGG